MDYQPQDPAPGAPDPNQAPYQPPMGGGQPGAPPAGEPGQPPYQPPQQPAGGYTPPQGGYTPPQGGYTPPQGGYPPQGDPNQPPYQPAGGGYGGGYSAPPKKGGFNWLACCGIGCGVVIIVTVLACALMWKFIGPFVGMGMEAGKVAEDVQKTDLATIKAGATPVDSATLAANPESYKEKWLDLTAELGDASSAGSNSSYGGQRGTNYVTKDFVMITDLSSAPSVGKKGDTIHAFGKIVIMDLAQVPFLKKAMEDEATKNPSEKIPSKIVMFMAKGVEAAGGGGIMDSIKHKGDSGDETKDTKDSSDDAKDKDAAPSDDSSSSSSDSSSDSSGDSKPTDS